MTDESSELDQATERLFAAGRGERPSPAARSRALERALASSRHASQRRQIGVAAALALAAGVTGIVWLETGGELPMAIQAERPSPTATTSAVVPPRTAEPAVPAAPANDGGEARRAHPSARMAPRPAPTLADELARLNEARAALAAGDAERALDVLERYRQATHRAQLGDEATLLRIDALARAGRRDEAAGLARAFVHENPGSPLVDRARAAAESLSGGPVPPKRELGDTPEQKGASEP